MKKTCFIVMTVLLAFLFTGCGKDFVAGASMEAQTFTLPVGPSKSYTAPYIILWDVDSGNMVNNTSGVPTLSLAWSSAAITSVLHTDVTIGGTNTFVYVFNFPALDSSYTYGLGVFDGTPASTDLMVSGPFIYDPRTNRTYSDTNNGTNGAIFTRPR